jgi:hypothetical protein
MAQHGLRNRAEEWRHFTFTRSPGDVPRRQ